MKKIISILIVFMFLLHCSSVKALSADKNVLITEVQTGSAVSASEEFIEIFNANSIDLDLTGWTMYYKSATGISWSKKATIVTGIVKSGEFWTFSANMTGKTSYSSGLAGTGGNIQIRDKLGNVVDQFGWGNANAPLGSPASFSAGGQSMYRLYNFDAKKFNNTDNNFADFDITDSPTIAKIPVQEQVEQDTEVMVYPKLELSEIFPDPTSPQVDTNDEFIEIYNPNDQEVDLAGWKLKDESGDEYLIKDKLLLPKSRLAIFAPDSKITLNNTGDIIYLIDPNGKTIDESADYENAEPGLSWSNIGGIWQWAVGPTANATNADPYFEDKLDPITTVSKVNKTATKKSSAKKPTISSSASKSSKIQGTASKIPNPSTSTDIKPESKSANSNLWTWLLVVAGIATIGYAIYEYRTEIYLFFKKLRRN